MVRKQALNRRPTSSEKVKTSAVTYNETWPTGFESELSCTLHHPIYDMFYLVLARRNNGRLLTLDKQLINAATKYSIETANL